MSLEPQPGGIHQATAQLVTEGVNPATVAIDQMTPMEIAQAMNAEDALIATAVQRELSQIAAAIESLADRLRSGGRLIVMGAGTSGRVGALDAYEIPPTFNLPQHQIMSRVAGASSPLVAGEDREDSAEDGRADAAGVGVNSADAVIAVSASGSTPYALGGIAFARTQGALTIGIANNAGSPLASLVDIMIAPITGPEVIAGSTRLKAGTAQKMVLNMLSTGAMILLGKTYGNLMVDVQATNAKLRQRALGIVRRVTGLDEAVANAHLTAAEGETKTAILMARTGLTLPLARERLAAHGQNLRAALEGDAS
jgi:N-acetylmuramic acid 6-phosphate etherase